MNPTQTHGPGKLVAMDAHGKGNGWFQCHIFPAPLRYGEHALFTAYGRTAESAEANAKLVCEAEEMQRALESCAILFESLDGIVWAEDSHVQPATYKQAAESVRALLTSAPSQGETGENK